jgi:hypothetical protein
VTKVTTRLLLVALAALALAASTAAVTPASSESADASGRFRVVYAKPRNADEATIVSLVKTSQLSKVAAELSKSLVLPRDVTISVQGGSDGPYYDPRRRVIVYNHPFSVFILNVVKAEYPRIPGYDLGVAFASIEYFVIFHEIGHALVHLWDIPVLGREEDAVDAFSTIFMTEFVPNGGQIALWGADFFDFLGRNHGRYGQVDFADEHSLDSQRAYSIACWVYGSGPKNYPSLEKILPRSRLVRCPSEYAQLRKAWLKFLKPHVRSK